MSLSVSHHNAIGSATLYELPLFLGVKKVFDLKIFLIDTQRHSPPKIFLH